MHQQAEPLSPSTLLPAGPAEMPLRQLHHGQDQLANIWCTVVLPASRTVCWVRHGARKHVDRCKQKLWEALHTTGAGTPQRRRCMPVCMPLLVAAKQHVAQEHNQEASGPHILV